MDIKCKFQGPPIKTLSPILLYVFQFPSEPQFQDEIVASLVFDSAGILAMANAGPNTNGSQFFITTVPTPHLNGNHTIFGQVIEGQDVVDAISRVDTNNQNRPLNSVTIENVEIVSTPR